MKNTTLENKVDTKFYVKNPQISKKNYDSNQLKFTMIIQ